MRFIITNPNAHGALSESDLDDFTGEIGCRLPDDYRLFLMGNNGGKPWPRSFWIVRGKDASIVHEFFGLHNGPSWLSLRWTSTNPIGVPSTLLPVATDGNSNFICIGKLPHVKEGVYFVDHEIHPHSVPDSFAGVTLIADSFSEFASRLGEADEGES